MCTTSSLNDWPLVSSWKQTADSWPNETALLDCAICLARGCLINCQCDCHYNLHINVSMIIKLTWRPIVSQCLLVANLGHYANIPFIRLGWWRLFSWDWIRQLNEYWHVFPHSQYIQMNRVSFPGFLYQDDWACIKAFQFSFCLCDFLRNLSVHMIMKVNKYVSNWRIYTCQRQ